MHEVRHPTNLSMHVSEEQYDFKQKNNIFLGMIFIAATILQIRKQIVAM